MSTPRSLPTEPLSAPTVRDEAWRRIGPVRLDRVVPERDALTLHHWLTHPASAFWQMTELGLDEVLAYQQRLAASTDEHAWIGRVDGRPTFMVETYDPSRVLLKGLYRARAGDVGMHLLVAPPQGAPLHGLTDAVMAATMRFCFETLRAQRVVVEPDVRNTAIAVKNAAAGFRVVREIDLPGKRAALSVCTREDFAASRLGSRPRRTTAPGPTGPGATVRGTPVVPGARTAREDGR
ncbi:acetyltransferase [Cellulomonas sp. zg-ZUI22]|uniref:GNAT family N-acetyltransferase n=1 Tax=Cellulomonas sp. zg-ZUI22 TaxID=2816955 RepID=UPI001A94A54E|nr:GNAT family N-acetyltransferase [Cellulomonas sp. zg-ZUI22]MBO0898405.1 acetyltransferase [Cellulomonas sp. zg-ZUI22]